MALAEIARDRARCHIGQAGAMRILDRFEAAFAELDRVAALAEDEEALLAEIWTMGGNLLFPLVRPTVLPPTARHSPLRARPAICPPRFRPWAMSAMPTIR